MSGRRVACVIPPPGTGRSPAVRDLLHGCWCSGKRVGGVMFPPVPLAGFASAVAARGFSPRVMDCPAEGISSAAAAADLRFLFALLLPALCRRRGGGGEEWPLLVFSLWPVLFYPLLQLEPRMLLPTVIGSCIFGAAALAAAGAFLAGRLSSPRLAWLPGAAVVAALVPRLPLLAHHTQEERGFHRDVGAWVAANLADDAAVTVDGYGYVTATGFWAGRRAMPRLWTSDPARLGTWASAGAPRVLIVYERYLREFNPELLQVLEGGVPRLRLAQSFDSPRVGRVQFWAAHPASPRLANVAGGGA